MVTVTVVFCYPSGMMDRALKLAKALLIKFGDQAYRFSVYLRPGEGGIFDVFVNDRRIFSKSEEGRYPEPEEILSLVQGVPCT